MDGGGVNKLEMGVQILKLFQGADLVLLTETSHFPGQDLLQIKRWLTWSNTHCVAGKNKHHKT
jgi:hypothetical protein